MSFLPQESQSRFVEGRIVDSGMRPQLFVVPVGTYVSSGSFGSRVAAVQPDTNNIESVTDRSGVSPCTTRGDVRVNGSDNDFEIQLSLDLSQPDPVAEGELRIRALPLTALESTRYGRSLPPSDKKYFRQPAFEDVEILLVDTTGASAPVHPPNVPAADNELRARFLYGGELALVQLSNAGATAVESPLLWVDLQNLFGATAQPQCLQINVRGTYRGDVSRGVSH